MSRSMMAKPYCGKLAQANNASVHRLMVSAHSDRTERRLPGQAFKGFDDVCCLRPGTSLVDGFFISGFQPGKGLIGAVRRIVRIASKLLFQALDEGFLEQVAARIWVQK